MVGDYNFQPRAFSEILLESICNIKTTLNSLVNTVNTYLIHLYLK